MIKPAVRRGFDRLAPVYDLGLLLFGNRIHRAQLHHLEHLAACQHLLLFGGGTGRLLVEIGTRFPHLHIHYLDGSPAMVAKAEQRWKLAGAPAQVTFQVGSWTDLPSDSLFDVILTPFVLDCLTDQQVEAAVHAFTPHASANTRWLFSDFHIAESGWRRLWTRLVVGFLYWFFRWSCGLERKLLPDVEACFNPLGWHAAERWISWDGLMEARSFTRAESAGTGRK